VDHTDGLFTAHVMIAVDSRPITAEQA